jgi:hypothetical protein
MKPATLSKKFTNEGQSLEIFVTYDPETNTVTDIQSVWLENAKGLIFEAGDILIHLFDEAINKIIDKTDWRGMYREIEDEVNAFVENSIRPALTQYLVTH